MENAKSSRELREHPIQLLYLAVKKLFIEAHVPPDLARTAEPESCSIFAGWSGYNEKTRRLAVTLRLEVSPEQSEEETPFTMSIEIMGIFTVDEERFPVEHISDWARKNAPVILYPYLREHAFGLSARCGFKPLLLPLVEVPTFTLERFDGD